MWSDLRAGRAHGELTITRTQQELAIVTTIIATFSFIVEKFENSDEQKEKIATVPFLQ